MQSGKYQDAAAECRKALEINPKDQTAVYRLIQALRKTGNQKELPDLLKQLAQLRKQAAKEEGERNRYRLVEGNSQPADTTQQ
jgi:two-component SAPR family response regulator